MAKHIYTNIEDLGDIKIKKIYFGDPNGLAKKLKKVYAGDNNGVARCVHYLNNCVHPDHYARPVSDTSHSWFCSDCDEFMFTEDCTFNYPTYDSDGHWTECNACSNYTDWSEHTMEHVKTEDAENCLNTGTDYYACSCGYEESRDNGVLGPHNYNIYIPNVSPSIETHMVKCSNCSVSYEEDCDQNAFDWSQSVEDLAQFHFYCCSKCGAYHPGNFGAHEGTLTGEVVNGWNMAVCDICGATYPHSEYEPQCDHESFTSCQTCDVCGEYIHIGNAEEYDYGPTCVDDHWRGATCDACGNDIWSEWVEPSTGHNFVDGVCTDCGESDPDYQEPQCEHNNVVDEWTPDGEYLGDFCQDCGEQVAWP